MPNQSVCLGQKVLGIMPNYSVCCTLQQSEIMLAASGFSSVASSTALKVPRPWSGLQINFFFLFHKFFFNVESLDNTPGVIWHRIHALGRKLYA